MIALDEKIAKQVLKALENTHDVGCKQTQEAITALSQVLGQPKQEPVAWRVKVKTKLSDGSVSVGYQFRNVRMSEYDEPLHTFPSAQRESLTDAQINAVAADIWGSALIAPQSYQLFARAIEAAHGIGE